MSAMASQITSVSIVCSINCSGADQRKHQSSASQAFVRGIHPSERASNAENASIWWSHHAHPWTNSSETVNKMHFFSQGNASKHVFCRTWAICSGLNMRMAHHISIYPTFTDINANEWFKSYTAHIISRDRTKQSLQWRHNERDGVPNHQPQDCLLKRLFRRRSKKTSKLRVTGLCEGNSPVTGEFPAQRASYAENVSIWWRHHIRKTRPVPWILMPWLPASRSLKEQWYWPIYISRSLPFMTEISFICTVSMSRNGEKVYVSSKDFNTSRYNPSDLLTESVDSYKPASKGPQTGDFQHNLSKSSHYLSIGHKRGPD